MTASLAPGALVEFTRILRREGIPLAAATAVDLATATELMGISSAEDTYYAFRALTVSAPDHLPIFDRVFAGFFGRRPDLNQIVLVSEVAKTWVVSLPRTEEGGEEDGQEPSEEASFAGASGVERLAAKDFAELTPHEAAQIRNLIARMVWRPSETQSRRRWPAGQGDRPDLRRTLRRAIRPEGELLQLAMSQRRPRRRPILFIADVSGSMERYSEMLLYFAHAARGRLGRLEAFVFSTRLTRITRQLLRRDPSTAISDVAVAVTDWSGGTRIGEAIETFNREWARRVVRGGPIAVIVSDGWDRGEPELLAREMARLRRTVYRVIWLNPLAGRFGFSPETRGMRAAMPYVDDFLPATNLIDLATVVELLESVPARRR
jgi:uncharacterized protein with von Willebrand factor type A (vWA) domain